ncbi:MAG: two-component regulator propeller domain-containing protein [Vicinamibacterales bacterium]
MLGDDEGLLNEVIRCLHEDREENIWIGTDYGLYRLSRNRLIPLQRLGVVRVVQADDSGVWVGTSTGLHRFEGTSQRVYGVRGELPSPFVSALGLDDNGALWIVTDRGIAVHRNGRFERVPFTGIESLNRVYSMAIDSGGGLLLADFNRGLFRAIHGTVVPMDVPPLDHRAVLSVHPDGEGRFWVSLSDGRIGYIERAADDRFSFTVPSGLPAGAVRLFSVLQEKPGDLWLVTSRGAWHYENGRLTVIDERNGLPSAQASAGAFDRDGAIWLGTSAGVLRIDRSAISHLADEPQAQITYGYWDAYDGAAGSPIYLGTPGVARDAAGRMWFVTANGSPSRIPNGCAAPPRCHRSSSRPCRSARSGWTTSPISSCRRAAHRSRSTTRR